MITCNDAATSQIFSDRESFFDELIERGKFYPVIRNGNFLESQKLGECVALIFCNGGCSPKTTVCNNLNLQTF